MHLELFSCFHLLYLLMSLFFRWKFCVLFFWKISIFYFHFLNIFFLFVLELSLWHLYSNQLCNLCDNMSVIIRKSHLDCQTTNYTTYDTHNICNTRTYTSVVWQSAFNKQTVGKLILISTPWSGSKQHAS